jgi:hypothetical protein
VTGFTPIAEVVGALPIIGVACVGVFGGGRSTVPESMGTGSKGGIGRGGYVDWRAHPERKDLSHAGTLDADLDDTGTCPIKPGDMVTVRR